jgi:Fe2+ or Zn2+ uptake regulation protein
LDNTLSNKIKSIIRNETGLGNERISTSEIYDKLTAAGVEVSELEVAEIIEQLEKEKLITVVHDVNRESKEKHSGYMITWVSGKL